MREKSNYMTDYFMEHIWAGYACTLRLKRTQANYFTAVCNLCDYAKTDFMDITGEQALSYFEARRRAIPQPAVKTMHTWLSCYRTLGRYIMANKTRISGAKDYHSPFDAIFLDNYSDDIDTKNLPTCDQLKKIMETAAMQQDGGQMYLILLFATKCAMTAGEILSLTPQKIQLDAAGRGFIAFRDKKRQNERIVKVPDVIMDFLNEHADIYSMRKTLFLNARGGALSDRSMQNYVRRVMEIAEMPKPYTLQDLRNLSIAKMLFYGASEEETAAYVGIMPGWMYRYSRILPELENAPCDLL